MPYDDGMQQPASPPSADEAFPYQGPPDLRAAITAALTRVVDPEIALSIVDIGLIYGVSVDESALRVRLTMTSAACPVTDVVVDDVRHELAGVAPAGVPIEVDLVWDPPWTPERLSPRARHFLEG